MKQARCYVALLTCLLMGFLLPTNSNCQDPYGISQESRWPYGPIFVCEYFGDLVYYGNGSVLMIYDVGDLNSPTMVREIELESSPKGILIDEGYLYITLEQYGLYIYDNSNPRNPVFKGKYEKDNYSPRFVKKGNIGAFAYSSAFDIIDLTDPTKPVMLSSIDIQNQPRGLEFHNDYLYISDWQKMMIFDTKNASNPTLEYETNITYVEQILIQDDIAYVGSYDTLNLYDVTDGANPILLSTTVERYAFDIFTLHGNYLLAGGAGRVEVFERTGNDFTLIRSKLFEGSIEDFKLKDNLLFCASSHYGLELIDVSDVRDMKLINTLETSSYTRDVKTHNGYIYAAQDRSGLGIYKLDNSGTTSQIKLLPYKRAWAIEIVDDLLYLANYDGGVVILDISNPTDPVELATIDVDGDARELDVEGNFIYVVKGKDGFSIVNISDLNNPSITATLPMEHVAVNVRVHDGYAYVCDWRDGFKIVDISNPGNPVIVSTYKTDSDNSVYVGYVWDVEIKGDYAYIPDQSYGFQVVDISDKYNPTKINHFRTGNRPYDVEIDGDVIYIALDYNGVMAYDISDPANAERLAYLNTGGELEKIHVSDGLIYGGDGTAGIVILNPWFTSSEEIAYDIPFEIKIYPNPATTTSMMEVTGKWNHPLMIKVITMDGKIIGSMLVNLQDGYASIPMNELMDSRSIQGIYYVVVSTGDKIKSIPIMWTF